MQRTKKILSIVIITILRVEGLKCNQNQNWKMPHFFWFFFDRYYTRCLLSSESILKLDFVYQIVLKELFAYALFIIVIVYLLLYILNQNSVLVMLFLFLHGKTAYLPFGKVHQQSTSLLTQIASFLGSLNISLSNCFKDSCFYFS